MSEYIVELNNNAVSGGKFLLGTVYLDAHEIVRCRDCVHATITVNGECKYCEMFLSPDTDGYGADPQLYLPDGFFCSWGERRES